MKSYKKLKSKKKIYDKRATISEMHDKKMKDYLEYYETLPEKEKELAEVNEKLKNIDLSDYKQYDVRIQLQDEHKRITKIVEEMRDQTDMLKYLSNVSGIFRKISNIHNKEGKVIKNDSSGINKYIVIKEGNQKGDLLDEYIVACGGYVPAKNNSSTNLFYCDDCKGECIVNSKECLITCETCGLCKTWQDPDTPQWSDEVEVTKAYRYKRLGYFIEHLYRIQAKECTVIPDHVINKLLIELRKRRITDPDKITVKLIKGFLKKLELSDYYDNANSIIRTLSGREAPEFPEELEDKLVIMFMRTQEPFEKYKNIIPDRNNYLSYPYVIRQLLIIISKTEENENILKFVKMFPLLKSRLKLWYQEKLWEKICEELQWPFHPSI